MAVLGENFCCKSKKAGEYFADFGVESKQYIMYNKAITIKEKNTMYKLRPKYTLLADGILFVVLGIFYMLFIDEIIGFNFPGIGVALIAVGVILAISGIVYISKETLEFNTKKIRVKGKEYAYSEIEIIQLNGLNQFGATIDDLNAHLSTKLQIRVNGKNIYTFTRKYKHFWEFKAVIESQGFRLDYF